MLFSVVKLRSSYNASTLTYSANHITIEMAAKLQIHAPYVLHALPRPLDRSDGLGRYFSGEVFGQKQGGKRKKRTELAVAIDGVAVYLYDVGIPNT
jgi:hypothetical protein